jgi:hypothetical protein
MNEKVTPVLAKMTLVSHSLLGPARRESEDVNKTRKKGMGKMGMEIV